MKNEPSNTMQLAWGTIMLPFNRNLLAMHKPMLQSDPIVYTNQVSQDYCNLCSFHFEYVDLT